MDRQRRGSASTLLELDSPDRQADEQTEEKLREKFFDS